MNDLMEILNQKLDEKTVRELGQRVGLQPDQASAAVQAALPMMLGGLSRQTQGASAGGLLDMLDQNNDGSILDDVLGYMQGKSGGGALPNMGSSGMGSAGDVLSQIFGGKQDAVAKTVGKSSGASSTAISQLMAMLAPLLLGAISRAKQQQQLDPEATRGWLQEQGRRAATQSPQSMDVLSQLLDSDKDGSIVDDLVEKGSVLLRGFLGGQGR